MMPLAPFLADCEVNTLLHWTKKLLAKSSFVKISMSKVGIVLLCVFLSRGEVLKAQDDSLMNFSPTWSECMNTLFASLQGRYMDLFPAPTESAYYVWQFLGLLVHNISVEQRHGLVVEVR
jgi:hypothetical protein